MQDAILSTAGFASNVSASLPVLTPTPSEGARANGHHQRSRKPTPLKAIRLRCVDCSETSTEVRDCEFEGGREELCPLYPFRMGHRPKGSSPLRAIRAYCLWCCDGSAAEVKVCHPLGCMLRRYRFGKNPALVGKRGPGRPWPKKGELMAGPAAGNGKDGSQVLPGIVAERAALAVVGMECETAR